MWNGHSFYLIIFQKLLILEWVCEYFIKICITYKVHFPYSWKENCLLPSLPDLSSGCSICKVDKTIAILFVVSVTWNPLKKTSQNPLHVACKCQVWWYCCFILINVSNLDSDSTSINGVHVVLEVTITSFILRKLRNVLSLSNICFKEVRIQS